ncbi:site-specific integrase [Aromatoleum buckelii]|nr:site-specific integrase [Aromatoleum buckelii]MCK0510247.1 site-specific integrase [Aromatoleum buckelii]
MTLDIEKLVTANPLLAGGGLISIPEAAAIIGLSVGSLLTELLNRGVEVFTWAQGWRGFHVLDLDAIDRDSDRTYIINDVETKGTSRVLSAPVRAHSSAATLAALLSTGISVEEVLRLKGREAFWLDSPTPVPLAAWMAPKRAVEAVRHRLAAAVPIAVVSPVAVAPGPALAPPAAEDPPTVRQSAKRFSELFTMYRKHRAWGEDQARRMAHEAGLFAELMDDPLVARIDVEMVQEYAARLARLPTDIYRTRRRYKIQPLPELMEIADRESLPLKNMKTIQGHVGRLAEVLNFGVSPAGLLRVNPAAGFKRGWGATKRARSQDDRDAFAPDELAEIFTRPWFATGSGAFTEKGSTGWRPSYYWLPLLALVTGGRLNELAQLHLDDIRQSDDESSVWYIDFNLDQSDKLDADSSGPNKSLKTVNAIRVVPLHRAVIDAGLPQYVSALHEAGHTRLFPELTRDRVKGYGKPAGSWFNERLLGRQLRMPRDGRKTFHSFRHNFATAIERLDVPERVMAQLLGHERGATQGGTRYAKDRKANELKPIIERLSFPCLAGIRGFDVQAALRALECSKQLKARVARRKSGEQVSAGADS